MKTKTNNKLKASLITAMLLGTLFIAASTASSKVAIVGEKGEIIGDTELPEIKSLTGAEDDPDPEYWPDYFPNGGCRAISSPDHRTIKNIDIQAVNGVQIVVIFLDDGTCIMYIIDC